MPAWTSSKPFLAKRIILPFRVPRTKKVPPNPLAFGLSFRKRRVRRRLEVPVAANQVVLYFEKQEDAVRFTLAASSVISADEQARALDAAAQVAKEISKASRITTEGALSAPDARTV